MTTRSKTRGRKNLTEEALRRTPFPKKGERRAELWDKKVTGLHVRISKGAGKVFFFRYRSSSGSQPRIRLGTYSALSLKDARELANDLLRRIARGEDPAAERDRLRAGEDTFAELAREYLDYAEHQKQNKRASLDEAQRQLRQYILPTWGTRPVEGLTPRDVRLVLEPIKKRGSLVQANRTYALLSAIFNFAIRHDRWQALVSENPVARTLKPMKKERSRERELTRDEIRRLWAALDDFDPVVAAAFKLRLLTAQRGGEIRHMRWSEIDGDWWTIPGNKTKNDRQHRVFLAGLTHKVLDSLRPLRKDDWVLASPRKVGQPVGTLAKANQRLRKAAELEDFTPHDLRRTAATYMAELDVEPHIIGRVLNHKDRSVTDRYNRFDYRPQIQSALSRWAERLDAILSDSEIAEVVSIRSA